MGKVIFYICSDSFYNTMKKIYLVLSLLMTASFAKAQTTMTIMEGAVFYDGYAALVNQPTPANVLRLRNDVMTTKLTDTQLGEIGDKLTVNITISALCDNYDRLGGVNIALVPKGSTTYNTGTVPKLEIGRFITPFMNKNVNPKSVPYTFEVNNVTRILKSPEIIAQYDFWLELEVFGVPYAANTQVAGCSGRNDVFEGKVEFVTNSPIPNWSPATVLQPLSFKADFNNYNANATDAVGTTVRTINFTVTEPLYDAKLYLITSNHGANSGGEEYIRRWHYVKIDNVLTLSYKPGGKSCEPYRQYNTQGNGIYGQTPQSESWWTSWNNWCPGDVVPTRVIDLGTLATGTHTFQISVPQAVFNNGEGNFPLSLYLQGNETDLADIESFTNEHIRVYPNPAENKVNIESAFDVTAVQLLNAYGEQVLSTDQSTLDVASLPAGMYFVRAQFEDGTTFTQQFVKN